MKPVSDKRIDLIGERVSKSFMLGVSPAAVNLTQALKAHVMTGAWRNRR